MSWDVNSFQLFNKVKTIFSSQAIQNSQDTGFSQHATDCRPDINNPFDMWTHLEKNQ